MPDEPSRPVNGAPDAHRPSPPDELDEASPPPDTVASEAPPRPPTSGLVTTTAVLYGGLTVVAVIWGLVDGRSNIYRLAGEVAARSVLLGAAAGVGVGLVAVVGSRLTTRWFAWARDLHREFHTLLQGLSTEQALLLALLSAVGEEALFRGAALPTLGLVWSSVLFGLAHVPVRKQLWPWPFMAFGMGLVFGWLFLRFGDLTGPICAHATINFLNLRHIARTAL